MGFALERQAFRGGLLGANLVLLYYLTEDQLIEFLARETGIKKIDLTKITIPKKVLQLIPLGLVEKYNVIPLGEKPPNSLYLACSDPTNIEVLDHLRFITGKKIIPLLATYSDVLEATTRFYYGVEVVTPQKEKKVQTPIQGTVETHKHKRIGEILLEAGVITRNQLDQALLRQQRRGGILGRSLTETGAITEQTLRVFLSEQMGVPEFDLSKVVITPELMKLVPQNIAEGYQMVPISLEKNVLTMACMDPTDLAAIDQARFFTGKEIHPVLASAFSINNFIDQYYRAVPLAGEMPDAAIPPAKYHPALETYEAHESPMGINPDEDPDLILFERD